MYIAYATIKHTIDNQPFPDIRHLKTFYIRHIFEMAKSQECVILSRISVNRQPMLGIRPT